MYWLEMVNTPNLLKSFKLNGEQTKHTEIKYMIQSQEMDCIQKTKIHSFKNIQALHLL